MKKQCEYCKREFSEYLIQPLVKMNLGERTSTLMCPICALEERNSVMGLPANSPFTALMAARLHREALLEVEQMKK